MFNIKKLVVLLLCAGLVFQAHFGIAGPQGGKVVGGNANISQSGPNTTINQTSDRAIINWNSFDIGKNESVRHNMPSSNSAGLHRVVGKGGPSNIEGLLQSNGNIYLVNPAGVVIHNGAKIDVNGFVATTRDIANENFMKGKMVFDKPGMPGAAIINQGNISLKDNGLAVLVAPTVRNDGIIAGKLGKVALGGSDAAWKLDMTGDDLIAFTMDEKTVNTLYAADGTPLASVQNNGKIKAEGGVVVLTASQLDGIVGSVVNNGEISAASAEMKGGKIIFRGQGNKVDVVNNGNLDVSSKAAEGGIVRMTGQAAVTHAGKIDATGKTKGGSVVITGENVTLKSGSRIDASGTNGGGTVLVGGNARGKGPEANAKTVHVQNDAAILADANLLGNGGQIVIWADEKTQFDGKATAKGGDNGGNGGLVETSAKLLIIGDPAVVNTSAKKGKAGEWLLDPEDFVIAAAGGTMTGKQISDSLENNNVNIEVGDDGDGNGDIIIKDKIQWDSDTNLSLSSYGDIIIVSDIIINGNSASLSIEPVNGNFIVSDSKVIFNGTNPELYIDSNKYTIIRSLLDLQNIEDTKGISYALGKDIDASETEYWDNGKGFKPIYFRGSFDGLGHSISNLYINRKNDEYIGLFSRISGDSSKIIANLSLLNINMLGYGKVGALAGYINGTGKTKIYNVFSHGIVQGRSGIGGLIGEADGIHIERSSSLSNVYTKFDDIHRGFGGGLIGSIDDDKFGSKVIKCYSAGNVEGKYVGGLIGFSCTPLIQDSYSLSNIIGHGEGGQAWVGGFIGQGEGQISNCYSVGKISVNYTEGRFRYIGGFIGSIAYPQTIQNCYWNIESSGQTKGMGMEAIGEGQPPESCIKGLTTAETMQQSSFKDWDFESTWKIDEGKGYPELRRIADNLSILPDYPVDPTPPIVDPDGPEPPDPKPNTPDTPDNPDVPVNPDLEPDTPVNPEKPVNPDPKPDNPVTPEQPSNPGNNPGGGTPSQPSTKPETKPEGKPDKPGTNQPVQPETPDSPEQPSNPGTTPGGDAPSQPSTKPEAKPETPVVPSKPSNPGGNSGGSNNINTGTTQIPAGSTITYRLVDGTVHVYRDNKYVGILANNSSNNINIPMEIEDDKTNIINGNWDGKDYDPYIATPEERQAYAEKIQRELEEQKASHNQALTEIFNDNQRKNITSIVDKAEKSISEEMNLLSDVIVDLYACELAIMGSIFVGEKISGAVGGLSNFGAAVHSNLKTILGTLTRNGWGDQLRSKPYIQALTTKNFMAFYMLTIAENAQKRFNQADNIADKLQLLCQIELATKLADSIANDYGDTLIYFAKESGEEAAKGLLDELVGKVLNNDNFKKYFEGKAESVADIAARTTNTPDLIREIAKRDDVIDTSAALTTQLSKGVINKTGYKDYFSPEQFKTDDSIQGMVNRLMYSNDVNNIINSTMEKYNGIVKNAGIEDSFQNGKISFNQDIRDCWNWDSGIATALNNIMTSDLPGAKLGDAIGNVLGPAIGTIFGFKPKQEQLSNLYTKSDNAQTF